MSTRKTRLIIAGCHFTAFLLLAAYIQLSGNSWAGILWVIFAAIDFPVSLAYLLDAGTWYPQWFNNLGDSMLAQIAYLPHFIHGFLGTIWWYLLPKIFATVLEYFRR